MLRPLQREQDRDDGGALVVASVAEDAMEQLLAADRLSPQLP
jgi:hypothetical protein